MVEAHPVPGSNVFEITVDGAFTHRDLKQAEDELERMLAMQPTVRVLEVVRHLGRLEPSAVWEDIRFAPRHLKHFSHVAVVAERGWIEWLTRALQPFVSPKMRFFPLEQLDRARQWLRTDEVRPS